MEDLEDELKNKQKINKSIDIEIVLGFIKHYHKPLEKQQIVDAVKYGQNNRGINMPHDRKIQNRYYNETFETNKETLK